MKKAVKWFSLFILIIAILWFSGPSPSRPHFEMHDFNLPVSLTDLEKQIQKSEMAVKGLRPDNEARIVWADTSKKEKTGISILYLHGFSSSQGEGYPVHRDLAKKYNANLYLSRLYEHGIDSGDSTMIGFTADDYILSAEKALQIAQKLGEEVIIMGTSAGGALALLLASRHPEIKAILLYAPCIALYDAGASLLDNHWGLQLGRFVYKGPDAIFEAKSEEHARYWMLKYRIEALVNLQNFLTHTMNTRTFEKVKCPVFMGYYYKNENEQDMTVSVPAMLKMFDELGTPVKLKKKVAFREAGAHVILSSIRSKEWQNVEIESDRFLSVITGKQAQGTL